MCTLPFQDIGAIDFGNGKAYYVCADAEQSFYDELYGKIVRRAGVKSVIDGTIPEGIAVSVRENEEHEYIFIQNFQSRPVEFMPELPGAQVLFGELSGQMKPFSTVVLQRRKE